MNMELTHKFKCKMKKKKTNTRLQIDQIFAYFSLNLCILAKEFFYLYGNIYFIILPRMFLHFPLPSCKCLSIVFLKKIFILAHISVPISARELNWERLLLSHHLFFLLSSFVTSSTWGIRSHFYPFHATICPNDQLYYSFYDFIFAF